MAHPDDEMAAGVADNGHFLTSRADREQAVDTLKAAFVQGRLSKDELDERVGQTLGSRTYADLAAVTADIPAPLAAGHAARQHSRARTGSAGRTLRTGARTVLALAVLAPLVAAPVAILARQAGDGAAGVADPDAQACQMFNAWLPMAEDPGPRGAWLLDGAVGVAGQGPDTGLLADMETLRQAVAQTVGPATMWPPGSLQSPGQDPVESAALSVSDDCQPYDY